MEDKISIGWKSKSPFQKKKRGKIVLYQLAFYLFLLVVGYVYFGNKQQYDQDHRRLYPFGPSCDDIDYEAEYEACAVDYDDSTDCSQATKFYKCIQNTAFACYENYVDTCLEELEDVCGSVPDCTCQTPQLYFADSFFDQPYCKNKGAPNSGAIILHIIGILYMFLGLSVVCDEYFCGALDVMVEHYKVKPDVAGATFMAAGGSAPELFTSLMGVFFSESDVGFGTIVGSAVFNVLFVIGLCGAFAKSTLLLTWWPLFRDCSYYLLSLSILTIFASDSIITFYEALILFIMYCLYVTLMRWNADLERFFEALLFKGKPVGPTTDSPKPSTPDPNKAEKDTPDDGSLCSHAQELNDDVPQLQVLPTTPSAKHMQQVVKRSVTRNLRRGSFFLDSARDTVEKRKSSMTGSGNIPIPMKASARGIAAKYDGDEEASSRSDVVPIEEKKSKTAVQPKTPTAADEAAGGSAQDVEKGQQATSVVKYGEDQDSLKNQKKVLLENDGNTNEKPSEAEKVEIKPDEADEEEEDHNPFEWPGGNKERFVFIMTLPVVAVLHFAIPNCSNPKYRDYFLATFSISLCWIAFFSYMLVWWATIFGAIIGIEDIIMGLTFLAAGTSIPDAVSSVVMARIGEGDMAVSSSIGSNIFDILFGLPVPWFISTAIVIPIETGAVGTIHVESKYIVVYVLLLIIMVFLVIASIMIRKWKLDKTLGAIMAGLYGVFLSVAISIEQTQPEALAI